MSLINEALKKAQRQRSLDAAPLSSAPSGVAAAAVSTYERTATHRRSYAPVWFGLGLLVLGAGATALIMHFGRSPESPAGTAPAPAPVAAQPSPIATTVTPIAATAAPASAATPLTDAAVVLPPIAPVAPSVTISQTTPPPAPPPSPTVTAAAAPASPAPTVAQTPAASLAAAPTPAPVAQPVQPVAVKPVPAAPSAAEREARVYSFLDTARITGVRGTGASARVLMNERVYRLNESVNADPALRLTAVRPGIMVFTDAQGKTYEKPY